jgi:hypothetical protein
VRFTLLGKIFFTTITTQRKMKGKTIEVCYFVNTTPRVVVGTNLTELCAFVNTELPPHLRISVSGVSRCVNEHSQSGVHRSCRIRVFDDSYAESLVAAEHRARGFFVNAETLRRVGGGHVDPAEPPVDVLPQPDRGMEAIDVPLEAQG